MAMAGAVVQGTAEGMAQGAVKAAAPKGRLERAGDLVALGASWIAAAALAVVVAINAANVAGRYLFHAPIIWAEEAMVFLMIVTVFFAAIAVTWRNTHIRIDVFLKFVPEKARRAIVALVVTVSVAVLVAVGVASLRVVGMLRMFDQRSDALHLPLWIPQGCIALGLFAYAAIIVLRQFLPAPEPELVPEEDVVALKGESAR